LVAIQSRLLDVHLGDVDKPIWTITNKCVYESAGTWNYMKNKKQEIRWWPLIWFPHTIPKQGFILWLTMLNRLTTGERLVVWGYQGDTMFFFFFPCKNGVESRDHLFFQCNFSSRTIVNPPLDWHDVIDEGCSKWKTKNC
jgi:hypothetical protein